MASAAFDAQHLVDSNPPANGRRQQIR